MDAYKYDHGPRRHLIRHTLTILVATALGVSAVVILLNLISSRHQHRPTPGATTLVPQKSTTTPTITINQPLYSMQLPSDWKQIKTDAHSVTWQATLKNMDNRTLQVFTDVIPTTFPVNRELPVTVQGSQLLYGELSDNCANFTPGGTLDVGQAEKMKPAPSVWQGVNFICNLPQVVDNQIGTGSTAGINTLTVTGLSQGTHSYFFLYIDRNIQPDYTIIYNALQSFQAK